MLKVKVKVQEQCSLFDFLIKSEENVAAIKAILSIKTSEEIWRGMLAVPPGSLIEEIVAEFGKKTDIPAELPFFTFVHSLAGYLLNKNIKLILDEKTTVRTDLWTVMLAPSGSSKTFSLDTIQNEISDIKDTSRTMSGIKSGAAFFDFVEKHNRKLFIRDEWNEFYKQIVSNPMYDEIKDYLLQASSGHAQLHRHTKKEGERTIDDVAFSILGMTVGTSFADALTADDLVNGFSQRFSYISAQRDPAKDFRDYPHYHVDSESWQTGWQQLVKRIKYKEYHVPSDAMETFKVAFRSMADDNLDVSFYRRLLFRAHKYALLYHIMRGRGDEQEVSPEDYGWAARITHLHLMDCKKLLNNHGLSQLEKTIRNAEVVADRIKKEGRAVKTRDLIIGVKNIKNVGEARVILELISRSKHN